MLTANENQSKELTDFFISNKLSNIIFFQVNENYFELNNRNTFIIDGGVQFVFGSKFISLGWSSDNNHFILDNTPFKSIYLNNNYKELNLKEITNYKKTRIVNAYFNTEKFDCIIDYTMKIRTETHYVELFLEFENKSTLQIALINFEVDSENFKYSLDDNILVSFNKRIKIKR